MTAATDPMGRDAGMTLVEMLVVLAIVGVMSGVAVLAMGASARDEDLRAEGERLAARLTAAADEAMVTGHSLALEWDPTGYRVVATDAQGRPAPKAAAAGGRHALPTRVRLSGDSARLPVDVDRAAPPRVLTLATSSQALDVVFDGFEARVTGARAR